MKDREDNTLVEMQVEALGWLIAQEKKIGFRSEEDKKKKDGKL